MPPKKRPQKKHKHNKPHKSGKPQRNIQRDDGTIKLDLSAMAYGGHALGSHKRRVVFVPYSIPGERVTARINRSEKAVDFADGVQLLDASADRVYPSCPHFGPGRCWGCQWQHIAYPAQLLLKQDVLADQLARVGKFDDPTLEAAMQPVLPSALQWGYNYHMTLERSADGRFGFHKIDGRAVEAITTCHILHADLLALYGQIEFDNTFTAAQRLQLLLGSDGATMMNLSMNSEDAPELSIDFPTSVNLVLPDNEPINLLGDTLVHYDIAGRRFRSTAGTYFRANVPQIENLVNEVCSQLALKGHENVLDLYAGVGVYSAFIADQAEVVTLVESYPPAVTDADENLKDNENVDMIEGSVEEVLAAMIEDGAEYHAAIVDPPGTGLSRDALNALLKLDLERIVYVSGNPATLARDAQRLVMAGYNLLRVQPLDFSPQTYYIDTVALLVKA